MSKVGDALIGGWRLSVIPTIRGGFPLSLGASNDESGTGTFAPRPNCIAPPHVLGKSQPLGSAQGGGYQWFDPSSYASPAPGTFGTCGVSSVRGPGEDNFDIGISKSFSMQRESESGVPRRVPERIQPPDPGRAQQRDWREPWNHSFLRRSAQHSVRLEVQLLARICGAGFTLHPKCRVLAVISSGTRHTPSKRTGI